ncbi:hypothetical protein [Raineyella sp. LH-20]|uniref:hypothetical protein n=1 Tax=Raineyella sp. LH-20 TaxID=3081204 RepID=UPI002952C7B3|nr:hypothetical protein [Raineyella sp. LH-20]WOP17403.1 hypothetical protein R0146_08920 [Raineyella sp. LH-20]
MDARKFGAPSTSAGTPPPPRSVAEIEAAEQTRQGAAEARKAERLALVDAARTRNAKVKARQALSRSETARPRPRTPGELKATTPTPRGAQIDTQGSTVAASTSAASSSSSPTSTPSVKTPKPCRACQGEAARQAMRRGQFYRC